MVVYIPIQIPMSICYASSLTQSDSMISNIQKCLAREDLFIIVCKGRESMYFLYKILTIINILRENETMVTYWPFSGTKHCTILMQR